MLFSSLFFLWLYFLYSVEVGEMKKGTKVCVLGGFFLVRIFFIAKDLLLVCGCVRA